MDYELMLRVSSFFAEAAIVTIQISTLAILIGLCLGFIAALAMLSHYRSLRWPAKTYVSIFRGTPALIQLFILYFGGPQFGLNLEPFEAGVIGLGLNIGSYMAESIRGAIISVDRGQIEAGRSLGMGRNQVMFKIILPQAAQLMVLPLGVNITALVKGSVIVSTISVVELTYTAHRFVSSTYKPFELFILASVFYLIIISFIAYGVKFVNKRFALETQS